MCQASLAFLVFAACVLACCAEPRNQQRHDRAELFSDKASEELLAIDKWQWVGLAGPNGFEGHRSIRYWATLVGGGSVFKNPKFQDNPSGVECVGTITLDREHNRVIVDMQRVVSKSGEAQKTEPHPANGTYAIEAVSSTPTPGQ